MKKLLKRKGFRIWILLSIVVIIIWLNTIFLILDSRNNNEKVFLDQALKGFEAEVNSTLATYELFSDYIFSNMEQDKEIKSILYQANFASVEEKQVLREKLYNKLHDKYLILKKYRYRQLHFHLPDTESFLRVHAPDKYGDKLFDIRESVRIVNEDLVNISGFEEGRIFNGFRYVYPLKYEDTHVGSVEISISSGSIIEVLSKNYANEDFYFIIDKSAVNDKVFDSEMINYNDSYIFDSYYMDREVDEITNQYNKIVPDSSDLFFNGFEEEQAENIKGKESFSALYSFDGKDYTVKFLSIKNFKDLPIAYLISISETLGYDKHTRDTYLEILLVSLLVFFIISFTLLVTLYQYKLKKSSELDYLTKIYNRNKFYELAEKEIRMSKRYKHVSSIMLMDIDHFKNINDSYGHEWGDIVLKELTSEIMKNIRNVDVFGRWGGEEFVLLLPHTKKSDAIKVAEKIRKLIDESSSPKLKDVTISIGLAEIDSEDYDIDKAINLADEAMYTAKRNGRNQVCCK